MLGTDGGAPIRVTVAVLAYGVEPDLASCVDSLLASRGVAVTVRLVDNGCSNPGLRELGRRPRVELLTPGVNTGFAGGCNLALSGVESGVVALVNSDAIVHPEALRSLADTVALEDVGIACADVRLMEDPSLLNTRGNPVHLTGLAWAGGLGEPARYGPVEDVAAATGAAMAMRAEVWRHLGGFSDHYFAYHEDVELSLRCWAGGMRVVHVPDAEALHRYEFSRNPDKMYLLERNRLITVVTVYPRGLLLRVLPVLLALEVALLLSAAAGGWLRAKLRGYGWLVRHRQWVWRRRRDVQARLSDHAAARLADVLTPRLPLNAGIAPGAVLSMCNVLCAMWWSLARPRYRRRARRSPGRSRASGRPGTLGPHGDE